MFVEERAKNCSENEEGNFREEECEGNVYERIAAVDVSERQTAKLLAERAAVTLSREAFNKQAAAAAAEPENQGGNSFYARHNITS